MPGAGVTCDANPATRVMFYEDYTAPDNQDDGTKYQFDYDKVWATMGTVGSNGIMRNGFLEEGDPWPGYPGMAWRTAGSIQQFAAGAFVVGGEFWNTVLQYQLWNTNAAGDYIMLGALAPSNGILFHLDVPTNVQPVFATEVLTNAAGAGTWAAVTVTKTPDFTQANGKKCQRLEFTFPNTWPELVFGPVPESRWFWRIRLITPSAFTPIGNKGLKDFLYGYHKFYACACELRHGDDGTGQNSSDFKHTGPHSIRFRAGPGRRWGNRVTGGIVQIGELDATNRDSTRAGWTMVSSDAPTIQPAELFGGYVCGVPHSPVLAGAAGILRGDNSAKGRLIETSFVGHGNWQLGSTGQALKRINAARFSKRESFTPYPAIQQIVMVPTSTQPFSDRIIIDATPGSGSQWAFRSTANVIETMGLQIAGDGLTVSQVFSTSPTKWNLMRILWGGPTNKWGSTAVAGLANMHEWWYLHVRLWADATMSPLVGKVVRITDSTGFVQLYGTTDASGYLAVFNLLSFAPSSVGSLARNMFCVETAGNGSNTTPVLRDEGMTIDINPANDAGFDPAYQSLTWQGRFPRRWEYDVTGDVFGFHDWQRQDAEVQVRLPLACPPAALPTPITLDVVPVEAAGVLRILTTVK